MRTDKDLVKALVIKLRLFLAQDIEYVANTYQRYLFAVDVLNLSVGRGMTIISSNDKVKHMTRKECENELRAISPTMYDVAFMEFYKRDAIKYRNEQKKRAGTL